MREVTIKRTEQRKRFREFVKRLKLERQNRRKKAS